MQSAGGKGREYRSHENAGWSIEGLYRALVLLARPSLGRGDLSPTVRVLAGVPG